MVAWRLSNGQILGVESNSREEWEYWHYDEEGILIDGGCVDKDHYPSEEVLALDLVYYMGTMVYLQEEISVDEIYDLEEAELERWSNQREYDDAALEVGFNPYMGCYDYDC